MPRRDRGLVTPLRVTGPVTCSCGLWDSSAGHYPLRWLPGDVRDEVVVGVVMQHGDTRSWSADLRAVHPAIRL